MLSSDLRIQNIEMRSHWERLGRIVVLLLEVAEALGGFLVSMDFFVVCIEVEDLPISDFDLYNLGVQTTHQGSDSVVESHPGSVEDCCDRMGRHLAVLAEAHCIVVEEVHSC